MQELLLEVWEQFKTTVVFVTTSTKPSCFRIESSSCSAQPGRIHEEINVAFREAEDH
jgi:NitT/TauT family transport system ATP-binding protein